MQHQDLASGRWQKFSLVDQLANVGSEVGRALSWQDKNEENSRMAFERGLELLDLTIEDPKNKKRLKELLRVREMLADYFMYDNIYSSNVEKWNSYFNAFNYAARINR
jgi:hypothetical protein